MRAAPRSRSASSRPDRWARSRPRSGVGSPALHRARGREPGQARHRRVRRVTRRARLTARTPPRGCARPLRSPRHRRHQPARHRRGVGHQPPHADLPLRLARGPAGRGDAAVEARQRAVMTATYDTDLPPLEAGAKYWEETVEATLRYGPLFFELAAHAMQGKDHAAALREELIAAWLPSVTELCLAIGIPERPGRDPRAPRPRRRPGAAPRPARQRPARGGRPSRTCSLSYGGRHAFFPDRPYCRPRRGRVAVLVPLAGSVPTASASESHPTNAAKVFRWGNASVKDEFTAGSRSAGRSTSRAWCATSTACSPSTRRAGAAPSRATLTGSPRRYGRWEARVRGRQYGGPGTAFHAIWELVPSRARHCGGRGVVLSDYALNGRRSRMHARNLPNHDFTASKRMALRDNQFHTYAVEMTRTPHLVVRRHQGDPHRAPFGRRAPGRRTTSASACRRRPAPRCARVGCRWTGSRYYTPRAQEREVDQRPAAATHVVRRRLLRRGRTTQRLLRPRRALAPPREGQRLDRQLVATDQRQCSDQAEGREDRADHERRAEPVDQRRRQRRLR